MNPDLILNKTNQKVSPFFIGGILDLCEKAFWKISLEYFFSTKVVRNHQFVTQIPLNVPDMYNSRFGYMLRRK